MSMKSRLESFLRETAEKTTVNNQYPVLTSSKTGLYLQSNYFNKQVASQDNKGYKIIRRGQFTYRAMSDTGEFFPNMLECTDVGIVSPAYPVFEISRPEVILSEYLKYYFKSSSFQQSIASFAQGSTRTSVKFAKMKTVSLDLPSIEQQKTVVKVLDKTKRIIDDREALLKGLDNLIKARFVEMFGMDVSDGVPLRECCIDVRGGGTPSMKHPEYYGGDVPFIKSGDVKDNLVFSGALWLTEKALSETTAKYIPEGSVIVVNRSAALLKEFRAAITGQPVVINQDIKAFIPKTTYTSQYLLWAIKIQTQYLLTKVTTVLTSHIDLKDLLELRIVPAPVEKQKAFSAFVKQIDKSKVVA